jgi:hypothetical protein
VAAISLVEQCVPCSHPLLRAKPANFSVLCPLLDGHLFILNPVNSTSRDRLVSTRAPSPHVPRSLLLISALAADLPGYESRRELKAEYSEALPVCTGGRSGPNPSCQVTHRQCFTHISPTSIPLHLLPGITEFMISRPDRCSPHFSTSRFKSLGMYFAFWGGSWNLTSVSE